MSGIKDVVVVVATHKKYLMPTDKMYFPLEVGVALRGKTTNFASDNSGDNISKKNTGYSELTALYWSWKNLKNDYIGISHYRRYFTENKLVHGNIKNRLGKVLTREQASEILEGTDVILPRRRNYLIENLYDHYIHTMYKEPLDMTGEIISKKYPEYYAEFERLHTRKKAHMFNMMIMRRDIFDGYCEWLFSILFELERKVDCADLKYDGFHARFYGRISELLLDVYINTKKIRYKEVPVVSIEPINWVRKGGAFMLAKTVGKKYGKSF